MITWVCRIKLEILVCWLAKGYSLESYTLSKYPIFVTLDYSIISLLIVSLQVQWIQYSHAVDRISGSTYFILFANRRIYYNERDTYSLLMVWYWSMYISPRGIVFFLNEHYPLPPSTLQIFSSFSEIWAWFLAHLFRLFASMWPSFESLYLLLPA